MSRLLLAVLFSTAVVSAQALPPPCNSGLVWADSNGNGVVDRGERPLAGIKVSDGVELVRTDADGRYLMPVVDGRTVFVIKPPGYGLPQRGDGLPDFWTHIRTAPGPTLKYGGIPAAFPSCRNFGLLPHKPLAGRGKALEILVFSDTQAKSATDIDYYRRDIVEPLAGKRKARFGITLGDVVNDDLSLYPALNQVTRLLQLPWLHVAGNHDLDFDAASDEDSLLTFRNSYGPDTFAWEEPQAVFIGLDDVVYQPGQKPTYVGGLREDQFAFLQAYLPTVPRDRLLVLGVHIPLFDAKPGVETFRHADRSRLFELLQEFPHVLVLSGHSHTQQHVYHGAASGWQGATPLHEYNVGAVCGAFWSGAKDAAGIPDSRMSDGTPNGYASLSVKPGGSYSLSWHPARDPEAALALYAPKVLRQGAYPAWGVYANVFMGQADTKVEYRIDAGDWKTMARVQQPDPGLLAENFRDDQAENLRGYDRSPEATPSMHLWRGALPTDLAVGGHEIEVRFFDTQGRAQSARARYRLETASP